MSESQEAAADERERYLRALRHMAGKDASFHLHGGTNVTGTLLAVHPENGQVRNTLPKVRRKDWTPWMCIEVVWKRF